MPSLMHFYPGFKPWELDEYTFGEIEELLTQMNEVSERAQDAAKSHAVEEQHAEHRHRLKLPPRPVFRHRS